MRVGRATHMSKKVPSGLPLNVLLLLSHDQVPLPGDELVDLEDACRTSADGLAYFATTRSLQSLLPGAEVAFYADGPDKFRLLATAEFQDFLPIESALAESILDRHALYGSRQLKRMRGLAILKNAALRPAGSSIDRLGGWLADGSRLSLSNLSTGHRRSSVYYMKTPDRRGPSIPDRLRLARAKVEELEDKYADTRSLIDREATRHRQVVEEKNRELRALLTEDERTSAGRAGQLSNLLLLSYRELFPSLRFLRHSAETLLTHYSHSRSIVTRLTRLNADPMLASGLHDGKALVGAHGWAEARFGDDLGRLYYRRVGSGRDVRVLVLISLKTRQERDVRLLRTLRDVDLLKL